MERRPDHRQSANTTLDSSGLGTFDVTWKARAEAAEGKTSPEELIAAAHSACFSMAFSNMLKHRPATRPRKINTKAEVDFAAGYRHHRQPPDAVRATVPGICEETSSAMAEAAKTGCPVSAGPGRRAEITLDATLAALSRCALQREEPRHIPDAPGFFTFTAGFSAGGGSAPILRPRRQRRRAAAGGSRRADGGRSVGSSWIISFSAPMPYSSCGSSPARVGVRREGHLDVRIHAVVLHAPAHAAA